MTPDKKLVTELAIIIHASTCGCDDFDPVASDASVHVRAAQTIAEFLAARGRLAPDRPEVGCCGAAVASEGHAHDPGCLYLLGLLDGRAEGGTPTVVSKGRK